MRRLTEAQAEALFEVMQDSPNCPDWFFADTTNPSTCPKTPVDEPVPIEYSTSGRRASILTDELTPEK